MERIKVTELDHIVLNVGDIDRSLKFYTDVLGLQAERLDEFKAGKVGFPSVRINGDTIIDLFPIRGLGMRTTRQRSDRETSIIFAWWWSNRISQGSLVIWRNTESPSAKDPSRAGARVAGRPRFIFSTPTGMKSKFVAIRLVGLCRIRGAGCGYGCLVSSSLIFTIRLPSISTIVSR